MSTNKDLLAKGVKYLFVALPLMFIGPSIMYNALMNKHTSIHYLILAIGILMSLLSMYLAFKGIKTITDALFNDKN